MSGHFFLWNNWTGRVNTRRWAVGTLLVGVYLLANVLTWVSQEWLLPILTPQDKQAGPTPITLHHFQQPEEWGFNPSTLPQVLDHITDERPGMLGKKWLYMGLLGTYLLLVCLVFLRFTQPPAPHKPD
jgi:hypothetical protein